MRILALLLAACSAVGQTRRPPPEPASHADGEIVATVSDSAGKPVAGAWVTLHGDSQRSSRTPRQVQRHGATDAAGRVRFHGLPNGSYYPQVTMAGRHDASGSTRVSLEGPEAAGSLELSVVRKPVLTGRVFDEAGTPLDHARVRALYLSEEDGEQRIVHSRSATTDDRGAYRLAFNLPGKYWLMASHSERSFPFGSAPRPTGIVFHPNSLELATAAAIELDFDQQERTLDMTLPAAPATTLAAAIVSGPGGQPCVQCDYSLYKVEGAFEYEVVRGGYARESRFDYSGIPAGQYRIYVEDRGAHPGWWAIGETVVVEGRPAETLIATQPPVEVAGRVVLVDPPPKSPRPRARGGKPLQIELGTQGRPPSYSWMRYGYGHVELDFDQTEFRLDPQPPGQRRFRAWVNGTGGYLARVSRGGRPLASPVVDLSEPGPWDDLELEIRFDAARLWLVVDTPASSPAQPESVYRIQVAADPQANSFGGEAAMVCQPRLPCNTPQLPPGRYRVLAIPGDGRSLRSSRDLKLWRERAAWVRTVDLEPGEELTLQLDLAPPDALEAP